MRTESGKAKLYKIMEIQKLDTLIKTLDLELSAILFRGNSLTVCGSNEYEDQP